MAACSEGHDSVSDDFCDVCGTRIGGDPASSPGRTAGKHHGPGLGAANTLTTLTTSLKDTSARGPLRPATSVGENLCRHRSHRHQRRGPGS